MAPFWQGTKHGLPKARFVRPRILGLGGGSADFIFMGARIFLTKACCSGANEGCTGARDRVALVQETLGRHFLKLAEVPFAPSPNHFWANLRLPASVAGTRGRNDSIATRRAIWGL